MPNYEALPKCPKDLPQDFYDSLKLYVEERVQPGGFLLAVLSNDLVDAVGRADAVAMASLKRIVQFVYCRLPGPCWGSKEKVQQWLDGDPKEWTPV